MVVFLITGWEKVIVDSWGRYLLWATVDGKPPVEKDFWRKILVEKNGRFISVEKFERQSFVLKSFWKILEIFCWSFMWKVDGFFLHIWKVKKEEKSFVWRVKVLLVIFSQRVAEPLKILYIFIDWIFIIGDFVLQLCKIYQLIVSYMQK